MSAPDRPKFLMPLIFHSFPMPVWQAKRSAAMMPTGRGQSKRYVGGPWTAAPRYQERDMQLASLTARCYEANMPQPMKRRPGRSSIRPATRWGRLAAPRSTERRTFAGQSSDAAAARAFICDTQSNNDSGLRTLSGRRLRNEGSRGLFFLLQRTQLRHAERCSRIGLD